MCLSSLLPPHSQGKVTSHIPSHAFHSHCHPHSCWGSRNSLAAGLCCGVDYSPSLCHELLLLLKSVRRDSHSVTRAWALLRTFSMLPSVCLPMVSINNSFMLPNLLRHRAEFPSSTNVNKEPCLRACLYGARPFSLPQSPFLVSTLWKQMHTLTHTRESLGQQMCKYFEKWVIGCVHLL